MRFKYLINLDSNEKIKNQYLQLKADTDTFNKKIADLNLEAAKLQQKFNENYNHSWEEIKNELFNLKLITETEKTHGAFEISKYDQVFLEEVVIPENKEVEVK